MDLELAGKTVLVTGASKGIGLAVAKGFAAEGCHLHLTSRTETDLRAAKGIIEQSYSVDVQIHPMDLSKPGTAEKLAVAAGDAAESLEELHAKRAINIIAIALMAMEFRI